ncbi:MAG: methylated-DNA--[protein]-cysteine S-methyltransferase [Hyphomicrobiaceae bacterium]|nr:methylated-DNA--[protein]-cysteine S-methyltransferase [Hyphomicrobiaceae bacterium]
MSSIRQRPMQGRHHIIDTALGPIGIAWSGRGITRLGLPEPDRSTLEGRMRRYGESAPPSAVPDGVAAALELLRHYTNGERVDFGPVVLDLGGMTGIAERIYQAARRIGWGETVTYGRLAREVGSLQLSRAVGQAMARNPVPIIVPCHRVLASGGKVGGFSGAGGTATKERLLALEGVALAPPAPLLDLMQSGAAAGGHRNS